MKNINIYHYDDDKTSRYNVKSYIESINSDFKELDIKINLSSFADHNKLIDKYEVSSPDLLILDMYDKSKNRVGDKVLSIIDGQEKNCKVFIWTIGNLRGNEVDYHSLSRDYPMLLDQDNTPILKSNRGTDLRSSIVKFLINEKIPILFDWDNDNLPLNMDIHSIGVSELNHLLFKIRKALTSENKFKVERLGGGFSGAVILKLRYDNSISILKVSKDKELLKLEHERSKDYYLKLPFNLRININSKEFETQNLTSFLLEEVKDSITLFDWILRTNDHSKIEELLSIIFLNNGLNHFYRDNRNNTEFKFTEIFKKIEGFKFSLVESAFNELKPILSAYDFKLSEIKNLCLNGVYNNIDKHSIKTTKKLPLLHGDLHSRNILVTNTNLPAIIDTGGMSHGYWCLDIARLITHLFFVGINHNTREYFDLDSLDKDLAIIKKIMTCEQIEDDSINNNIIFTINWLVNHCEIIYEDLYSKWEFQLGLMKELLQISYRTNSIPPNKRAVALIAAYECMLIADFNSQ